MTTSEKVTQKLNRLTHTIELLRYQYATIADNEYRMCLISITTKYEQQFFDMQAVYLNEYDQFDNFLAKVGFALVD